jgi:hypothetical protein
MQVSAASAVPLRARIATLPGWATVGALVLVSTLVRALLARRIVAPWIFADETYYSELAKSFAANGHFAIRGTPTSAYGFVYPVLVSPAYALFDSVPQAYAAVKGINAALMSLTAVPVYLLARRVVSVRGALVAVVLTLVLPALAYTGTIMTENAFMPLFCLTALALVRALERPTLGRQSAVVALVAVDFLTRAQAIAFLPAIVVAPLLYAAFAGRAAQLRRYVPLALALLGVALVAVLAEVVRGRSPFALLGAYAVTGHTHYPLVTIARWAVYHVALVDLGVALVPLLALVLLLARARRLDLPLQAFLAATAALAFFFLAEVAAFSVTQSGGRLEERNLFYVEPLLVVALVAWIERGLPRPGRVAVPAALVLGVLPALIPFRNDSVFGVSSESDTPTLVLWWYIQHELVARSHLWALVLAAGILVAALALVVPRRRAFALPLVVGLALVLSFRTIEGWIPWGMRGAALGALYQGVTQPHPDWVDRRLGHGADVAFVWSSALPRNGFTLRETQFFNRSVHGIYDLGTGPSPERLGETAVRVGARGELLAGGRPVRARYALAAVANHLAGRRLGIDAPKGLALYRVDGPLRVTAWSSGIDADAWSTPTARYTLLPCRAGHALDVTLGSDRHLFRRRQIVSVLENGRLVDVRRIDPKAPDSTWALPLRPRGGACRFVFRVAPTAVPGKGDTRTLGVRFTGFAVR